MSYILPSLDAEWQRIARGPAARRALRRWAELHPDLHGAAHLDDLLERRRDPAAAPGILAALADLALTDELAARTLLQALLPGLVRMASSTGYDDPAAIEDIVSLAWERIRTYPIARPGPVAGNILLDVKKRYRQHRTIDAPRSPELPVEVTGATRSAEDEVVDRIAFRDLLAAQRKVVGERGLRAVVRTRVFGLSLADVAAEENVRVHTITQRRWLAVHRLRQLALAQ
jgi:hypothetical protein